MKELIKMLQKAHAGEIAAYHAYEGHWRSLKDARQRKIIKCIQKDELQHIQYIETLLDMHGGKPSVIRDFIFKMIGKSASLLCYITGWYLPMFGAKFIEKIGIVNYNVMSAKADKLGMYNEAYVFKMMAAVEADHECAIKDMINEAAE